MQLELYTLKVCLELVLPKLETKRVRRLRKQPHRANRNRWQISSESLVNVAEGASRRADQLSNLPRWPSSVPVIIVIIETGVPARGVVQKRDGTPNSRGPRSALRGGLHLPHPPDPVEHCVVEVERWVGWGGEQVAAWVTAHRPVAC